MIDVYEIKAILKIFWFGIFLNKYRPLTKDGFIAIYTINLLK
jgi:hypothetical protein